MTKKDFIELIKQGSINEFKVEDLIQQFTGEVMAIYFTWGFDYFVIAQTNNSKVYNQIIKIATANGYKRADIRGTRLFVKGDTKIEKTFSLREFIKYEALKRDDIQLKNLYASISPFGWTLKCDGKKVNANNKIGDFGVIDEWCTYKTK